MSGKEKAEKIKKDISKKRVAFATLQFFNGQDPEKMNTKDLAKLLKATLQVLGYVNEEGKVDVQ